MQNVIRRRVWSGSAVLADSHLKVLWIFKKKIEILQGLNDSDEKTKMLKTPS